MLLSCFSLTETALLKSQQVLLVQLPCLDSETSVSQHIVGRSSAIESLWDAFKK